MLTLRHAVLASMLLLSACGDDAETPGADDAGTPGDGAPGDGSSDLPDASTSDGASEDGSDGAPGEDGSIGEEPDAGSEQPTTDGPVLPLPTVACPEFTNATLKFGEREAQVWVDADKAATLDGPVVFYWYGTFGQTSQAEFALGKANIDRITALGGIVVAPKYAGSGMFPWLDQGTHEFELVDEVVGCAEEKIGIDDKQIHSVGMSAGGIFTSYLSFARANYLASVVTWSGGAEGTLSDPNNKFAAMVYHGGSLDNAFGHDFVASSDEYTGILRAAGHYVLVCNHGMGHFFPPSGGEQAVSFFLDRPFGATAAYAALPDFVPDTCTAE